MSGHVVAINDAIRWLRGLPDASVDLVLTDPPYSSGGFNESGRRSGSSYSRDMPWLMGDALSTPGICHLIREVAIECRRVVKSTGAMDLFTDFKMAAILAPVIESAGWRYRSLIVWDKTSHGSGQGWMPQHELVMHFGSADTVYLAHQPNVIRCRRVPKDEREHPTQKPEDLLLTLMRPHVVSGGVVADPFAGSGSVMGAASRLGAVAWCCDADPERLPAMRRRAEYSGVPQTLPGMDP